jgi:hypothetical protein
VINYVDDGPASPYQPGVCNIGPAEIARRRRSAIATTVLAALVAVGLVATGVPAMVRIALWPFAAAAGIQWLQVVRKFCVGFGAAGLLNFGELGDHSSVEEAAARAADRRTAVRMALEGASYGLVVAVILVLLPV